MEDWSGLTPAEIRARVAAAREPAQRAFLANCGTEVLPGETLEQAVRRVQFVIFGVIRHAAATALPNETFQQSMDRVLSRRN
jgi:broad specificity phosphatase PhoE